MSKSVYVRVFQELELLRYVEMNKVDCYCYGRTNTMVR